MNRGVQVGGYLGVSRLQVRDRAAKVNLVVDPTVVHQDVQLGEILRRPGNRCLALFPPRDVGNPKIEDGYKTLKLKIIDLFHCVT